MEIHLFQLDPIFRRRRSYLLDIARQHEQWEDKLCFVKQNRNEISYQYVVPQEDERKRIEEVHTSNGHVGINATWDAVSFNSNCVNQ